MEPIIPEPTARPPPPSNKSETASKPQHNLALPTELDHYATEMTCGHEDCLDAN